MNDNNLGTIIDLDVMLDTRLALLYALAEDTAVTEINSGKYDKRIRDNFGNITSNVFNSFYRRRHKGLLKYALPTSIFKLVNEIIIGELSDSISTAIPKIYVNTYPYILGKDEEDIILNMCNGLFKNCEIVLVRMHDITELTPVWVKDNVHTIIKYNGLEWLENHNKLFNLSNTPLMDKTLIVPAILTGKVPSNMKIDIKFFTTISTSIKSLIKVMFTDIVYFNSFLKK